MIMNALERVFACVNDVPESRSLLAQCSALELCKWQTRLSRENRPHLIDALE